MEADDSTWHKGAKLQWEPSGGHFNHKHKQYTITVQIIVPITLMTRLLTFECGPFVASLQMDYLVSDRKHISLCVESSERSWNSWNTLKSA